MIFTNDKNTLYIFMRVPAEVIMKHVLPSISPIVFISIIMLSMSVVSNSQASRLPGELPAYSQGYDENRNPNADGREALKLAKKTHRLLLIEVGGDWCSWCHVLDRFIKDHPNIESRLHQIFVVLKVNISDVNDNAEFMAVFPPARGYPHMYITDSSGTILYSQDTANFRENKEYSEKLFMVFFDHWQNYYE